jgi:hypothetical protein
VYSLLVLRVSSALPKQRGLIPDLDRPGYFETETSSAA